MIVLTMLGATAITVDAGASFLVRDIIKFFSLTKYSVTGISSNTLTIKAINQPSAVSKCSC